jgi:hypothetical protein
VPHRILLTYCALFLFVTAVATATIFVAATNRSQRDIDAHNRGSGYAWELFGSGFAALLTLVWFLPALGLNRLLLALLVLTAFGLLGSSFTPAARPQES